MTIVFTLSTLIIAALLDRFYDVPLRNYLGQKFISKRTVIA
jgi:hypothetical protein